MEIYFDNSATTKPYEEVIEVVSKGMREYFGNPSSLHNLGIKSERRLNEAREFLAKTICANADEIFFTSGGSETNNLILRGMLKSGNHIITTIFEHSSVLATCKEMEKNGVRVTYLEVDEYGKISLEDLKEAICKDTVLVSIIHVNNELGVIQDIESIGKVIKENSKRARFHVDGVQSYGKLDINIDKMNIDLLTVAGHKIHGPKGSGFCYIKKGIVLNSIIAGGNQEGGVRAGTQNIPAVIGLQKAAEITFNNEAANYKKIWDLKSYMIKELSDIKDIRINSPLREDFSPYILNVSFSGVRGEVLLHLLEENGIFVSTGSACTSKSSTVSGSYVIKSLNIDKCYIEGAIRFSFSHENTKEEVDEVINVLKNSLKFLRRVTR